jgi:hypothetical protein
MTKMKEKKRKRKIQKTGSNNEQEEAIIICIQEVIHDEKKQIHTATQTHIEFD